MSGLLVHGLPSMREMTGRTPHVGQDKTQSGAIASAKQRIATHHASATAARNNAADVFFKKGAAIPKGANAYLIQPVVRSGTYPAPSPPRAAPPTQMVDGKGQRVTRQS